MCVFAVGVVVDEAVLVCCVCVCVCVYVMQACTHVVRECVCDKWPIYSFGLLITEMCVECTSEVIEVLSLVLSFLGGQTWSHDY